MVNKLRTVICFLPTTLSRSRERGARVVWANTYNKFGPTSPFGGYKDSGFGREGGLHGLAAYCRVD